MRDCGAMHEESCLSGWLREVGGGIAMSGEKGCKEVKERRRRGQQKRRRKIIEKTVVFKCKCETVSVVVL